jgi:isocitrate dehydrogenase (NAD+)
MIGTDAAESIKIITRHASERIASFAFNYAVKEKRRKVTCVHKANIMQLTDGLFLSSVRYIASKYPDIEYDEMTAENLCMKLVMCPEKFDILVLPNLYGDLVSELGAGLVGGLGVVPGVNIGAESAVYEATHGTAPDLVGKGIANPTASIMCGAMLLKRLGERDAAERINKSILKVLAEAKYVTPDLGGSATTDEMVRAIINNL